ncbi:MAG: hypothetical protein EAZ24_15450 [Burkholderiales bacterium]|nr:MAG: hypothetical protein EAZ24_15450 [Burkholderiales bacterium]TAG78245.1 MAG: hypothetical protein EAZ21_13155 [Betaproteobacteria bacterium]
MLLLLNRQPGQHYSAADAYLAARRAPLRTLNPTLAAVASAGLSDLKAQSAARRNAVTYSSFP